MDMCWQHMLLKMAMERMGQTMD